MKTHPNLYVAVHEGNVVESGRRMSIMAKNHPSANEGAAGEIVVFILRKPSTCGDCGEELWKGNIIRLEAGKALCLGCADLDHLEYLPRGDAAVTRRAGKYSKLRAVVVRWSQTRKRYERQGILAEAEAIERAEQESLADADFREWQRQRRAERAEEGDREYEAAFAAAVRAQYPGCPAGAETRIAAHACRRSSGRVGRTAAAKELDPQALRLAVLAHIRHVHTPYDEHLARTGDRQLARETVHHQVQAILRQWERSEKETDTGR